MLGASPLFNRMPLCHPLTLMSYYIIYQYLGILIVYVNMCMCTKLDFFLYDNNQTWFLFLFKSETWFHKWNFVMPQIQFSIHCAMRKILYRIYIYIYSFSQTYYLLYYVVKWSITYIELRRAASIYLSMKLFLYTYYIWYFI